jgi:hypothetical protein
MNGTIIVAHNFDILSAKRQPVGASLLVGNRLNADFIERRGLAGDRRTQQRRCRADDRRSNDRAHLVPRRLSGERRHGEDRRAAA